LAHEFGHVLGLDHPCGPAPGARAVACLEDHKSSVMYPSPVEAGRTPVLAPTRGEARALCASYASPTR
jgi:hypothetical protein